MPRLAGCRATLKRPLTVVPGGGAPSRACSASSSSVAGRSVRWMVKLQPSRSVSARISARCRATRVSYSPFQASARPAVMRAGAFRLDELDAAGIGKGLLGRIDDLHDMAVGAGRRELRERLAHLRHRAPEIRHHHDLGERRGRKGRRQARPLGHVVHDRVRHLVEHVAAAGRPHQARHADALAGLHQHLGEREGDDQAAIELGFLRQLRREHHRRRAIGPQPHRMRGLPLPLAHVEMFVAGGAAPVDPARGLARQEAAVLPEILARPGPLAAVQPVDDGGGDAARLEDEARQRVRERAGLAARVLRRLDLVLVRAALAAIRLSDARLEPADDALPGSRRRRARRR